MKAEELISILIRLSKSDKHFDEFEFGYIINVGKHLDVPNHIVESLVKDPFIEDIQVPKSEQERMAILYYLLFMMKIDQNIREEEKDMIQHYGFKLGFSRGMINDFIHLMEEYKESRVPISEMLEIIKKYKNWVLDSRCQILDTRCTII